MLIKISQWKNSIEAGKGTILDSALMNGVPYPHQCRSGECGRCKSRVICGNVEQLPCMSIALSEQEKNDNLILACRCIPTSDVEVAWLSEDSSTAADIPHYTFRVVALDRVGRVVKLSVRQVAEEVPMRFSAGQYVDFHLPGCPVRPYSMATVNGLETLDFHIEYHSGGKVSKTVALELEVGDQFAVSGPFGNACLNSDESGPLLAIGAGTGMAPMLSIVKTGLAANPQRPVALIYIENESTNQYLHDELQSLSARYKTIQIHQLVTNPGPGKSDSLNHQLTDCLLHLPFSMSATSVYIAGSRKKVQIVANTVKLLGANSDLIRADAFSITADDISNRSIVSRLRKILFGEQQR